MQKLSHSIWKWKVLSWLAWEEMTTLSLPLFDYRELVALMKLDTVPTLSIYNYLYTFSKKALICKRDHLGCSIWLSINQNIQCYLVYCLSMHFPIAYTQGRLHKERAGGKIYPKGTKDTTSTSYHISGTYLQGAWGQCLLQMKNFTRFCPPPPK